MTTDGVSETRTRDAQNRITGAGNATLAFDPGGNMLTDEHGQRYAYDAWNRLNVASRIVVASRPKFKL